MKKYSKLFAGLFLFSLLFASCSTNNSGAVLSDVSPVLSGNSWRVSHFSERGIDETSDFSGYSFVFESGGKLTATKGSTTKEGTWSEDKSSHKLIIDLGAKSDSNKPLGELTDDWFIKSNSSTKISLADDNSASNEILEFTKN
jgi:hypothetical protein